MASNKAPATYNNLKSLITEAIDDIDTHLKSVAFDISTSDKDTANRTINKIRKKLKLLEEQSKDMVSGLERDKQEVERQNEILANEVKRLKEELDDTFPDHIFSESDVRLSQHKSHENTNQCDNKRKYQDASCQGSYALVADSDNKRYAHDDKKGEANQPDNQGNN